MSNDKTTEKVDTVPGGGSAVERLVMQLHKDGPCMACCGAGDDFDYCRCCGFTVLPIPDESKQEEESPLARAIKKARGGDEPVRMVGYA